VHVGTVAGPRVPAGWSPVSAADFNGDGHIDVLLFNPTTRQTWIGYLFGATQGDYGPTLRSGWQLVGTADFNQDGHPDFLLFNSSTRQTLISYMNNNIHVGGAFGPTIPGSITGLVAVADFNGDGNPDFLFFPVHRCPGCGFWTFIWYMNNNVPAGWAWGTPIPGLSLVGATDFNRNGKADILLYNWSTRQTGIWYMNDNVRVGTAAGPNIPTGWNLFAP